MTLSVDFFGSDRRKNPKSAEYIDGNGNPITLRQYLTGSIQDLATGVGNVINTASTAATYDQWQREQQAVQEQRDWELQVWNMNNEYNSPTSQMARYAEAGLNPNLIYGSGSASAGNSSSAPDASKANAPQSHELSLQALQNLLSVPFALLNAYQDYKLKKAQVSNAEIIRDINAENLVKKSGENDFWFRSGRFMFGDKLGENYFTMYNKDRWRINDENKTAAIIRNLISKGSQEYYNSLYRQSVGSIGEQAMKWQTADWIRDMALYQHDIAFHNRRLAERAFTDLEKAVWNSADHLGQSLLSLIPNPNKLVKSMVKRNH